MTTATQRMERYDVIAAQADQARPGHAVATVITAFFYAIGYILGGTWRGVAFCFLAVRLGYREGRHVPVTPAQPPGREQG